jgi:Flp pilus assembly protein TadG
MSPDHVRVGAARRPFSRGTCDTGLASIELVILLPAFVLLVLLATYLGRTNLAQTSVDGAAQDAARAASLQRDHDHARTAAQAAAAAALNAKDSPCQFNTATATITNDTVGHDPFATPLGTPSQVDVLVTCKLSVADLAFPGFPLPGGATGEITMTSTFASPIDEYRVRTEPSSSAP